MTGFADDPDEIRRQFPDLATLAATVPMGAFLDAMAAGRAHAAGYARRTTDLRPTEGQTNAGLAAEVADEVLEVVYCRVLAAYSAEATQ